MLRERANRVIAALASVGVDALRQPKKWERNFKFTDLLRKVEQTHPN